ncbi:hypothetical protein Asi03nite_35140 [Actinoplanes siamensis]|uniref:Uncharacterized protein n=1 Tax=Actinoplanes siamensis TaxID=1223317 RepID=A0A919TKF4_9ACTN|nr:hypothetical protein Asi03nite_35140 [Actinoplanes siamensis]
MRSSAAIRAAAHVHRLLFVSNARASPGRPAPQLPQRYPAQASAQLAYLALYRNGSGKIFVAGDRQGILSR